MRRKGPFWMLLLALVPGLVHATPVVTEAAAPIAGGWQPAAIDESVQEIARFALAERQLQEAKPLRLLSVREASRQVVAGLNYRLRLRVKRGGRDREASATVYQDLQGQRRLIAWEWQPCRSSQSNRTGANP
jgi:hypothetical protein